MSERTPQLLRSGSNDSCCCRLGFSYCFMFELCTTRNRVVVRYDTDRLIVHGARHRVTLKEEHPRMFAAAYGWELVKEWDVASLEEVQAMAQALCPTDAEGFVVCDAQFRRIKGASCGRCGCARCRRLALAWRATGATGPM